MPLDRDSLERTEEHYQVGIIDEGMSLSVSPEMEARIIAQASAEGISVDEYLQDLVNTSEEFVAAMCRLNESLDPLPPEAVSAKITRGLEELARGEYVDGETFMDELLSEIENRRDPSPSG